MELYQALLLFVTTCVAVMGIDAWRRESRWRRKHDVAEEALTLFNEARDNIAALRTPRGWDCEGVPRRRESDETQIVSDIRDRVHAARQRYEQYRPSFNKLHAMKHRFMSLFGAEHAQSFDEIRRAVDKIRDAYEHYGRDSVWVAREESRGGGIDATSRKPVSERILGYQVVIDHGDQPDEIDRIVASAVDRIDQECASVLRPRSWWDSLREHWVPIVIVPMLVLALLGELALVWRSL